MGQEVSRLLTLSSNPLWKVWPWKHWRSPLDRARMLPTFVINEWSYRAVALACLYHAKSTNNLPLLLSGVIAATSNDILFMFLPFADQFWQAQACVMLTPRLPLYIVEMYVALLYSSSTAARRLGLPYLGEAALTGVLAHMFYGPYDVNGPRFLWWTWHDGDPAVSARHSNAPVGSSVWILTYTACHALLIRWVNDPKAVPSQVLVDVLKAVKDRLPYLARSSAMQHRLLGLLDRFVQGADTLHRQLLHGPWALKIAFCSLACTPMFMIYMGQLQIFSFDKIGIPGPRTYRLLLLLYAVILARTVLRGEAHWTPNRQRGDVTADTNLLKFILMHFGVQTGVALFGEPTVHSSTGCHQRYGIRGQEISYDMLGWEREDVVSGSSPHLNSKFDYTFPSMREDGKYDRNGDEIIAPKPNGLASEWYTVKGVPHKNRTNEVGSVLGFCILGALSFTYALSRGG